MMSLNCLSTNNAQSLHYYCIVDELLKETRNGPQTLKRHFKSNLKEQTSLCIIEIGSDWKDVKRGRCLVTEL